MAQNITLLGASYSDVPAVTLPKTGGGTASFFDVSDTTAAAADVASGKYFYTDAGVKTAGTASGGGGWTLVKSTEIELSTTSTSSTSAGTIELGSQYFSSDIILYVRVRDKVGKRAGYFFGTDAYIENFYPSQSSLSTATYPAVVTYRYTTSNALAGYTGGYGLWGYSIGSQGTLTMRKRYHATYTLTVNSTYTVDVYAIAPPKTLF